MEEILGVFAEERLLQIVELVNLRGKVTVADLSEELAVSSVTIRRDLEKLEEKELLLRTHGGALSLQAAQMDDTAKEKSFFEKQESHPIEKEKIAQRAADLVEDGDAILLTPGTTSMLIARKLTGKRNLTIVTNAVNIAMQLADQDGWDVILTGGKIREKSFALVGPLADQTLSNIRVDKLFLGVDGIDFKAGLTTPNLLESNVNRQMIEIAKQVYVVADSSKFGKVLFSRIASLDVAQMIISDEFLSETNRRMVKEAGIPLLLA